jgi:hypothetical protein
MNLNTAIATGMFALPMVAMVLFLMVWCLRELVAYRGIRRARHGKSRSAFELESSARGLILLRSWLSPTQLRSYDGYEYFDVIGSDSGGTYRIHHGKQANVEQLDRSGQPVCAWCLVPEGDLVPGDVMLAQKIALETNERAALAIAISYSTSHPRVVTRGRPLAMS